MSFAVNLLPRSIVHARFRAQRRRRWGALAGCLVAALIVTWTLHMASQDQQRTWALESLELQRQTADAARQAMELMARIADLRRQLEALQAHHDRAHWPARYARLTAAAPSGVFVARLNVQVQDRGARPSEPPGPAAANAAAPTTAPAASSGAARFRMVAYAQDHAQMLAFIAAAQRFAGCPDVELVSAVTDSRYPGLGVRFECAGLAAEVLP